TRPAFPAARSRPETKSRVRHPARFLAGPPRSRVDNDYARRAPSANPRPDSPAIRALFADRVRRPEMGSSGTKPLQLVPASLSSVESGKMAYSVATGALKTPVLLQERLTPPLRVLSVIPAEEEGAAMIFAKRQVRALREVGVVSEPFFLSSRTSPFILVREWRRLRREIRSFRPDLIHAHFGTMTAFFCALSGTRPLVVTYRGSDLNPCPNIPRLRAGLGKVLSQIASLRARRAICVSEQLKGRLLCAKAR